MGLRIATVVPGRFDAFELVQALRDRGHQVHLFTNYPRWAVRRFGLSTQDVQGRWVQGVEVRLRARWAGVLGRHLEAGELNRRFGRWAARQVASRSWDVVHAWSGYAEEVFQALPDGARTLKLLQRSSAHIRAQAEILEEEVRRTGIALERPNDWIIAREEREYALADRIRILSGFCERTFLEQGVEARRLWRIPSGAPVEGFRPSPEVVRARQERIRSGHPLRVVFVGTKSLRKGMFDLEKLVDLAGGQFQFRLVGPEAPEARAILGRLRGRVELVPKQPQRLLPEQYAWADLYLLPSVEEGYPQTTAQAAASALPILTTENAGGEELVDEGRTGWIVPARRPELLLERLRWCDAHRPELAQIVERLFASVRPRGWDQVAQELEAAIGRYFAAPAEVATRP